MAQNYSVYSFADTSVVINHPDVGQEVLSDGGMGRIVISYTAEMASHTQTANGHTTEDDTNPEGLTASVVFREVLQKEAAKKAKSKSKVPPPANQGETPPQRGSYLAISNNPDINMIHYTQ